MAAIIFQSLPLVDTSLEVWGREWVALALGFTFGCVVEPGGTP